MTVVAVVALAPRPPAWDVLALALAERRPVRARYRGAERVLCPHVLGWKSGRAKTRCYQTGGTTGHGGLPSNPAQRWRSLFVDDLEDVKLRPQSSMVDGTELLALDQLCRPGRDLRCP